MGSSESLHFELTEKNPSVYRLWQQARKEGGSEGEQIDRYRELLEQYGHRGEVTGKW
jgi:hypothetical protein